MLKIHPEIINDGSLIKSDANFKSETIKDRLFKQKLIKNVQCQKAENKIKNISVTVKNHEMVHRIFLPDYAMYHMEVHPLNIVCKRTYSDFVHLKDTLVELYPCIKVPYLEGSSWLA